LKHVGPPADGASLSDGAELVTNVTFAYGDVGDVVAGEHVVQQLVANVRQASVERRAPWDDPL